MTEKELNEEKKKHLYSYKNTCSKIESLNQQLESLRIEMKSAKNQIISDMPRAGKQKDLSDIMVRLERLKNDINKKTAERYEKKISIEKQIADMEVGKECDILRKRYLEGKEWEEICVEVGYSWKHTHRLHSKALKNFKMT